MPHPLLILLAALLTGCSAFFYARSKGGYWSSTLFGALAFVAPISLPLITLYLMGRPLPGGGHIKPPLVIALTVANLVAILGIISVLVALADR